MSIEIKELSITNWLVYKGCVRLAFGKPEPGKNLWVVHGLNGAGKTSLLKAIQWGFRNGRLAEKFFDAPLLHNRDAIRSGDPRLEVTIRFSHRGQDCVLTRAQTALIRDQTAKGVRGSELTLVVDGRDESNSAEDKLAKILPWDCQQFAFFDGLEIQSYAQKQHNTQTRSAIELILGIPEVRNLREDLEKLAHELENERDIALRDTEAYQRLRQQKDSLQTDKESWGERLVRQKENINSLELIVRDLETQAARLAHNHERLKELESKERLLEELKDSLRSLDLKQQTLTSKAPLFLVKDLLVSRLRSLEDAASVESIRNQKKVYQSARIEIIEKLLDSGKCICNREITSEISSFLEAELKSAKQMTLVKEETGRATAGGSIEITRDLRVLLSRLNQQERDPDALLLLRLKKEQDKEEVEQDIEKLKAQLSEDADVDVQSVIQALEAKRKDQRQAQEEYDRCIDEISKTESEIDKVEKQLNQHLVGMQGYEGLQNEIDYLQRSRAAVNELVDRFVQDRHATIEANLNRVFRHITNKPQEYDKVALLEDFSLRVVTKAGNRIEPDRLSAGEKEVLAFSFIAGLNLASDNPAPLVMDTPFGHLDVQHRNGLLAALPTFPNQVILLATDRDLPKEEHSRLERNIAGEFELARIQEEERTTIRPL